MSTITERVAAGAAFLDENDPDWWKADVDRAIYLETLELESSSMCILGQRCPLETLRSYYQETLDPDGPRVDWSYAYAAYCEVLSGLDAAAAREWAAERGFNLLVRDHGIEFADLTAEWKRVITERRSA